MPKSILIKESFKILLRLKLNNEKDFVALFLVINQLNIYLIYKMALNIYTWSGVVGQSSFTLSSVEKTEEAAREYITKTIRQIDSLKLDYDEIQLEKLRLSATENALEKAHLVAFRKGQTGDLTAIQLKKEKNDKELVKLDNAQRVLISQVHVDISNMFAEYITPFSFYSGAKLYIPKEAKFMTVRQFIETAPHVRPFDSRVSISTSMY